MKIQRLHESWKVAFANQARSDWRAHEVLAKASLPACHRLHQLQMFLEKVCKAHMWGEYEIKDGSPDFSRSHNVIKKVLPVLVREHCLRHEKVNLDIAQIRDICREIDLLAPAVDDNGNRPDNSEYPWAGTRDGQPVVQAPSDWSFSVDQRLRTPTGKLLLKAAFALLESL